MVRKDQRKADRVSELRSDLVTVRNNVTVLSQMLASFNPAEGSLESNDVIQDLYRGCSDMRAKLATTAGEVDEKDDTLAEVLAANDELTRVLEMYDAVRAGRRAGVAAPADAGAMGDLSLIDFGGPATLAPTPSSSVVDQFGGLALGRRCVSTACVLSSPRRRPFPCSAHCRVPSGCPSSLSGSSAGQPAALPTQAAPPAAAGIDLLGGLMASPAPVAQATVPPAAGGDLLGGLGDLLGGAPPAAAAAVAAPPPNLATLEIPLASIEPAQIPPTPVYDQNSIKVMFHHSKNPPHPTMCVIVVSFVNFNSVPVENLK